ncbi:MAG: zf-HC2 domain-containing protein [Planctomycetes bacterium]|nr:zf-HC2 domain-containing protein [Planctomycetota bacterium]
MNCTECKEKLVELIEGLLSDTQRQTVQEHLKGCQQCRGEFKELKELNERLASDGKTWQQTDLEDAVFNRVIRKQHEKLKQADRIGRQFRIWRQIMNKPITKLATAAAIIIIVALGILLLQNSATTVYAIEQTIEAGQDVRFLHFYQSSFDSITTFKEAWLEYDDSGQIKNTRVNWYNQPSGDLVAVWKEGRTQYWVKKKNTLKFFEDEIYTKKCVGFAKRYDPTRTVENMYDLEKKGDVEIEIQEPDDKTSPIILTCTWLTNTYLTEGTSPQMREIVYVDQVTKLVTLIEIYEFKDGKYVGLGVWEYPDYDTLFEPGIFDLEKVVPVDVKRLDLMTLDIGLERTDLTEKEIAVKVVRSFVQALIAKNYDRAIKIYGYEDPDEKEGLRKRFEKLNIVQIISVGDPVSPPRMNSSGKLRVPCKVELEKDGQIIEWQIEGVFAQRVIGHPNRWHVEGKFEK